jgi:CRP-like cAMP-binding protein
MRAGTQRRATGNRFVDALPDDVVDAITRAGDFRVLAEGTRVAQRGEPVRDVIFPVSGAIAHVEEHGDGRRTEIAAIGCEGVSAFEALLDQPRAQFSAIASVPASALAIDVRKLQPIYAGCALFGRLLRRYAIASIRLAAISAACERHDHLTARLARWLLALYDHAGTAELAVTHERAARMLGVRRPGVTRAAAEIAGTGAVRWERARLQLVDAARLESLACGCYAEAKAVIDEVYR